MNPLAPNLRGQADANLGMSDKPKKKRSGTWIIWTALVIFVLYPLSIGPACLISEKTGTSLAWVDIAYYPVWWVSSKSHAASRVFMWYLDLW